MCAVVQSLFHQIQDKLCTPPCPHTKECAKVSLVPSNSTVMVESEGTNRTFKHWLVVMEQAS
jgi:hypothetical protein